MATLRLMHPEFAGLQYGANNEIQFGSRGGNPDFIAVVDEDHPLLGALLRDEPTIRILRGDGEPAAVFPCPYGDHDDFKTRNGWLEHMAEVHGMGGETDEDDGDEDPASGPETATGASLTVVPPVDTAKPPAAPRKRSTRRRAKPRAKAPAVSSSDASSPPAPATDPAK